MVEKAVHAGVKGLAKFIVSFRPLWRGLHSGGRGSAYMSLLFARLELCRLDLSGEASTVGMLV